MQQDSNFNFLLESKATHVGQVRKANEDSCDIFAVANMKVFVVCDGMGGHVGGQVASQTAITTIHEYLLNNVVIDPREAIHNSIVAANEAILNKARQQPELSGMGSTCVMLVVTSDGKVYYGHVGDSRIYIVANHKITQLTEDHSFVQTLVKAKQITEEQAEHHPRKNEITNALGLQGMLPPTVCDTPIEPNSGYCFLLCSDGLSGMVNKEQIKRVVSKHEIPIQQRAETLIKMANEAGGVDNITVELVEFTVGVQDIGTGKKAKIWKKPLYVLPVAFLCGVATAVGIGWWLEMTKTDGNKTPAGTTQRDTTYVTTPIPIGAPIVKITDFPDTDTIIENSVKVDNENVKIKIDGKFIELEWKNEFNGDTIKIVCKTKSARECTIKIPINDNKEKNNSQIEVIVNPLQGKIDSNPVQQLPKPRAKLDGKNPQSSGGGATEKPEPTDKAKVAESPSAAEAVIESPAN